MVIWSFHPRCPLESPGELKKEGARVPSDQFNWNLRGSPRDSNGQPELKPSPLRSPLVVWACVSILCQVRTESNTACGKNSQRQQVEQFSVLNMPETWPLVAIPKASNSLSPAANILNVAGTQIWAWIKPWDCYHFLRRELETPSPLPVNELLTQRDSCCNCL